MLTAALLAIFLIPLVFVLVRRGVRMRWPARSDGWPRGATVKGRPRETRAPDAFGDRHGGRTLDPPQPVTPLSVLESARLVPARYPEGIDSYLTSLYAQRLFYAAQRAQVLVQLAELHNRATLYQVLGGS